MKKTELKKRNPIAFDLCTNALCKTKVEQNKKKDVRRFNARNTRDWNSSL